MIVRIIGVPIDLGQTRRGVDMGPSAIRYAQLHERIRSIGHEVEDAGNIFVPLMESTRLHDQKLRFLPEVMAVAKRTADVVESAMREGRFPLVLGGDHSLAVGSIAGVARVKPRTAVVWFDAHGDFNTRDTTPSGNIHGMAFASALGVGGPDLCVDGRPTGISPSSCALIGARALDPGERENLKRSGINVFTMHEIDKYGMKEVISLALDRTRDCDGMHISFDIDVLDPLEAPGVGTSVRGGLDYREAHLAMELLAESGRVTSMDMVEVNPILDEQNRTAELAAELCASALGSRILR